MKKIIAYLPMMICFYLGHWISIPVYKYDLAKLYPIYNNLMDYSLRLNDWAKMNFWEREEIE